MPKADLSGVFALLPEKDQEAAIIHSLELKFARSEWPLINDLLAPIMALQGHENLRANALSTGIKGALRLREFDLAFDRYQLLLENGQAYGYLSLQVEALWQMAIHMLPAKADKLSDLWEQFSSLDMPNEAQELWAQTGVLLYQAFSKNRQKARAKEIKAAMRNKLPEPLWNMTEHRLK